MNNSEKSRILLICIGLNPNPGYPQEVSIDDLFLVFHIFGKINSIIIFSQKSPVKAFVEFSQIAEAEKVKESLHDKHLNAFGKIRVFPSPLEKLETSNKFLEVKDFKDVDQKQYLSQILAKLDAGVNKANIFEQSFIKKTSQKDKDSSPGNVFLEEKLDETKSISLSGKKENEKEVLIHKINKVSSFYSTKQ
jgi:hypothetical protein